MKIFISWSGQESRAIALALSEWIPKVIQGVVPFVSSKDIDKGAFWASTLKETLSGTDFGIVCLTEANLTSPWLHYEAGSLSKSMDSRVCPVLLNVKKSSVNPPLAQLQMTELTDRDDVYDLMRSINTAKKSELADSQVEESVETWWEKLQQALEKVTSSPDDEVDQGSEPQKPQTSTDETLSEILASVRELTDRTRQLELLVKEPHRWDVVDTRQKRARARLAEDPVLLGNISDKSRRTPLKDFYDVIESGAPSSTVLNKAQRALLAGGLSDSELAHIRAALNNV